MPFVCVTPETRSYRLCEKRARYSQRGIRLASYLHRRFEGVARVRALSAANVGTERHRCGYEDLPGHGNDLQPLESRKHTGGDDWTLRMKKIRNILGASTRSTGFGTCDTCHNLSNELILGLKCYLTANEDAFTLCMVFDSFHYE
jgi:hypothetical protein